MKRFITSISVFLVIIMALISIGFLLPPTEASRKLIYWSALQKESLFAHSPSPRIIFIGDSNFAFGIVSPLVKDALHYNPINMAISADLGKRYFIERTKPYIKEDDVVVLSICYQSYLDSYYQVSPSLCKSLIEVHHWEGVSSLTTKELAEFSLYAMRIAASRLNPAEYISNVSLEKKPVYDVNAYNSFGDCVTHYGLPSIPFSQEHLSPAPVHPDVLSALHTYNDYLQSKGSKFVITYQPYPEISYRSSIEAIHVIDSTLRANGFAIAGKPERYIMPDSLMFDSPAHCNEAGAIRRTRLLIEDLREHL